MIATGKRFENRIKSWHKGIDCFTFKYPDHASTGTFQNAICDRITVARRGVFFFECKTTMSKTSFSFRLIKPHQWVSMMKLQTYNQHTYFLIENGNHDVFMAHPLELWKMYINGFKSIKFTHNYLTKINKKQFKKLINNS